MKEDFVTFEIAKKLKEKGMSMPNHLSFAIYKDNGELSEMRFIGGGVDNYELAPSISQALKWLIKEKTLYIAADIKKAYPEGNLLYWGFVVLDVKNGDLVHFEHNKESYEQAILAGIEYTLDNLI